MQRAIEPNRRAPVAGIHRRALRWSAALVVGVIGAGVPMRATADNFARVVYDAASDEVVLVIRYRGSNPDHGFSLKWAACKDGADGAPRDAAAEVLDDQWRDRALNDYKKTVRLSLAAMPCRPARLTLRIAPRFYATIDVP